MHSRTERYRLSITWLMAGVIVFFIVFTKAKNEDTLGYEFLEVFGYGLIVLATLGRIWAGVYIGGRKDDELCQEGPYSLSRNPLYLFSLMGAAGIILAAEKIILLPVLLPFALYYYVVIKHEEKRLARFFGPAYDEYASKVNRFLPRLPLAYSSPESMVVYPKVLFRSMVHASLFMWVFFLLEVLEYLKAKTDLVPILFYLPF